MLADALTLEDTMKTLSSTLSRMALIVSPVFVACGPASPKPDGTPDDTTPTVAEDTEDTEAGTDTGEVPDDSTETSIKPETLPELDTSPPPSPPESPVSELSWRVNSDVATIIEITFTLTEDTDEVWLAWTTDARYQATSPVRALAAGEHSEVVLGVPADTELSVSVMATVGEYTTLSEPLSATTGSLPDDLENPGLVDWDQASASADEWLLTSVEVGRSNFFGPYYPVILNRLGEIVWYRQYDDDRLTMFPRVSRDGTHLLVDTTKIYQGRTAELNRLTLDHSQQEVAAPPNWTLTYDVLPDGTILYDESTSGYQFYLSALHPDGTHERLWDCTEWMSTIKTVGYWECMPNTIVWNEASNTILWSMFETSTVIELDLETGEVVRQFGALEGSWDFSPAEAGFNLQHFPSYTDAGTLIVSTHGASSPGQHQYAREYELDDATGTLEEIWRFENDLGYYAEYAGEAKRLPNGNTLVGFGTDGAILEVDAAGEVVWGVEWPGKLVGQATLVEDIYTLNQGW